MLVDLLGGADAVPGGFPTENVLLIIGNWLNRGDALHSLTVKSVSQKLHVPGTSVRSPLVRDRGWKW